MTGGAQVTAETQPKLFIFPHAGGSAQYYVPFAKTFTTDIKRVAVQYPGQRGKQDFASFTSLPALADEVCKMVSPDK
ncbi:MAG: thioesterase domain-containing protein, partial [Mycobacterium sp.]